MKLLRQQAIYRNTNVFSLVSRLGQSQKAPMSTAAGWGLEISVRYVVVYSGEAGGCVDRQAAIRKMQDGWRPYLLSVPGL